MKNLYIECGETIVHLNAIGVIDIIETDGYYESYVYDMFGQEICEVVEDNACGLENCLGSVWKEQLKTYLDNK